MMLSPTTTQIVLGVLMLAVVAAVAYCSHSLHRQALGRDIHAHADGTVHEHHRGSVAHEHPTLGDRHERVLRRLFRETV